MPKFRIKPEYIIKAKDETAALVKLYKARAHRREDAYFSSVEIEEAIESDWLTPKVYKSKIVEDEDE